jgi:hypothetical protein
VAERLDDLAGVALTEHEAGGCDVEPEPEQGGHEQQRGEHGEVERLLHEHRRQQDDEREQDADDDEHVEQHGRHGHDEQHDDADDPNGHGEQAQIAFHVRPFRGVVRS